MNSLYFSIKKGAGPVIAVADHHWTPGMEAANAIRRTLAATLSGLEEELEKVRAQH